jgi:hypothetical protein
MRVYPAIYDFSILPIGLGSILGWVIKQCIRSIECGADAMDVYIVADNQSLSNRFQPHIDKNSYQVHLLEVLWAFYTNPMMRNMHFFHERSEFERVIERFQGGDAFQKLALEKYRDAQMRNTTRENANQLLIEYCEGYKGIFDFFDKNQYIPKLIAPRGCDLHARAFRERIGSNKFVVTTNFRMGSVAVARAEDADHTTASTFSAWYDFFKAAEKRYPEVLFLVLGKLPEIPMMCLDLKNVISPRMCGLNLGHELALIKHCDLFLAAPSGFASMAWFNDVPFVIPGLNKEGYAWVGYEFGIERYNFSNPQQRLLFEDESVELLSKHLEIHLDQWRTRQRRGDQKPESNGKGRNAFLYGRETEINRELTAYLQEKIAAEGNYARPENAGKILECLDTVVSDYPGIAEKLPLFYSMKALALLQLNRLSEAESAIQMSACSQPENPSVRQIREMIQNAAGKTQV